MRVWKHPSKTSGEEIHPVHQKSGNLLQTYKVRIIVPQHYIYIYIYYISITRMATVDHKTKVFCKFFHILWFLSAPRSSRHIPSKAPSQRPIKRLKRCVAPCTLEMPWSFTTDGHHLHRGWTNIQWMNMFFEYPIHSITVPSLAIPNTKVETSVKLLCEIQSSSATFCSVQSLWNHFHYHNLCSRHGATGSKGPYR